jgi:trigger factor
MATRVEQLGGDRVRLTVDVPAHDVQHAVAHAANDLATSVKVPGFRRGKVPVPVLVSRLGRERIYAEAVETHIGGWLRSAISSTRVQPAEQPAYDYQLPANDVEDWKFTAEFAVQPKPDLPDWRQLEVPRLEIDVPGEVVQQQLEVLQRSVAEIVPADGRAAQDGDVAVIDLVAEDQAQRDVVVELGSGLLVEEIENGVRDLRAGESRDVAYELGDGSRRHATVTLKELKEKVLAPLDDDLAQSASEFDTLAELEADIEGSIRTQLDAEIDGRFRVAAVDELVKATDVNPAGYLVETRTRELLAGFVRSLQSRGIDARSYLELTGQSPEALEARLRGEAAHSVARELVLEALADQLELEVTDDEIRGDLVEAGEDEADIDAFFAEGGAERIREDLRLKKALDRLVDEVQGISAERAAEKAEQEAARESIWTPEKERAAAETKLWTPGS